MDQSSFLQQSLSESAIVQQKPSLLNEQTMDMAKTKGRYPENNNKM